VPSSQRFLTDRRSVQKLSCSSFPAPSKLWALHAPCKREREREKWREGGKRKGPTPWSLECTGDGETRQALRWRDE
jgi:hypothetical protein